ncbi:MAG: hypothetical protein BAJALOKI1v1_800016 [Promethearchaeota archaeon]|nr:MAG: hypothetical protein BAJALOKI1v1_800016 [Candidatus Lokiarchaeota archaeon]
MKTKDLFNDMINVFKREFKNVMKKFNDERRFELNESQNHRFCFSLEYYNQKIIDVNYNKNKIMEEYFQNDINKKELEDIFIYLARHEYCHNLITDSSEELKDSKIQGTEIKQIQRFNYINFENQFGEFFADYMVKRHFDNIPQKYLEKVLVYFEEEMDLNYYCHGVLPISGDSINTRDQLQIYSFLRNLYKFYICGEWNLLKPLFQNINFDNLLKFFRLIFKYFELTITNLKDISKIRNSIITLVKRLDTCKFENLIFHNKLDNQVIEILKFR